MSWSKDKCYNECKENWENVYMNDSFEECMDAMTENYGCGASCSKYVNLSYKYVDDITYNGEEPWRQGNDDCWIDTFLFGLVATELHAPFKNYLDYLNKLSGNAQQLAILLSNYITLLKTKKPEKHIIKFKLIELLKEIYNDVVLTSSVSEPKACQYSVGTTFFLGNLFKTYRSNIGYYITEERSSLKNIISRTCKTHSSDEVIIIDLPAYQCEDCHTTTFREILTAGKDSGYTLQSIVIGNNIHYVNYSKIKNIWMYYDNQSAILLEQKNSSDVLSFNNNGHSLKMGEDITLFFLREAAVKDGRRKPEKSRKRRSGGRRSGGRRRSDGKKKKRSPKRRR